MGLPVEEQPCVQAIMTRRRATAEAYYQINKKTMQAVHGAEALKRKLKTADSIATLPPGETEFQADSTSQDNQSPASSRSDLTEDQLTDIDLLFADILHTNAALTFTIVKSRMSESLNFVEHTGDPKLVHKVYNRVKYLQGKSLEQNFKHKTSQSGPAPITMLENLMTNLEAYIKNVRPHFAKEG